MCVCLDSTCILKLGKCNWILYDFIFASKPIQSKLAILHGVGVCLTCVTGHNILLRKTVHWFHYYLATTVPMHM